MPDAYSESDAHDDVARLVLASRRILFITGAGISADSGLPTYRGVGGLYEETLTSEGWTIEEALSGAMMASRPEITWKYLLQIARTCSGAEPNTAHRVIAALETALPEVLVYTQNVDGLHAAAGSRNLIEIHGALRDLRCTHCRFGTTVDNYADLPIPPLCPRCFAPLRPAVVLFGEALPEAAVARLEDELARGFDLVFSIGTSGLFPYIVEPVVLARRAGVPCIEINPDETPLSGIVDIALRERAAPAMGALWSALQTRLQQM